MIVIICDATKETGYGHLKRCLVIAFFYRQFGILVNFLMRKTFPVVKELLHKYDMGLVIRSNFEECRSYLFKKKHHIKLVIIDHYEIGADLEKKIFGILPTLVIDDLCRPHWCDMLLDQTIDREPHHYDKKLYNSSVQTMLGVEYTLIDPVYHKIKSSGNKSNILISFGATDPDKAAIKILKILEQKMGEGRKIVFHVPLSSISPCFKEVQKFIHKSKIDIRLHKDLSDLTGLYEKCGIAVGAPGTSLLERIYCGLINITIDVAQNQREVGRNFANHGITVSLGDITTIDSYALIHKLTQIINSSSFGCELQKKANKLIDGKGAIRIIKQTILLISSLRLRSANKNDCEILYKWQHEKSARKYFRYTKPPEKSKHQEWLENALLNDDIKIFIIEWCDMSVGYIRLSGKGKIKEISILIAQKFQNFGFAKQALLKILKSRKNIFTAFIKSENKASIALFSSSGFKSLGKGNYIYNETL